MDFKEIQDLLKLVNRTDLTEVEIEDGDFKLKIRKQEPDSQIIYQTPPPATSIHAPVLTAPPAAEQTAASSPQLSPAVPAGEEDISHLFEFKSPMIGTFYRSSSPETPSFVKVGDQIQKGDTVCIVEAMKLFNEIESEVDGKIVKIMVENAQPVEYDQVLFLIDTNV